MLDKDGVKTCDDGDIRVYEHYGINMPLRARYVRYPNRIYFATDPEHGEMMSFFCSAEKPSSCARGLAWYWGENAYHLVCVDELEPPRPGAIEPGTGEMAPNGDEQREQLRAIWTLGGRWLAKDADGVVNYYIKMPYKENGYWYEPDNDEKYGYAIPLSVGVCELRELNKADEPLDIGKALGVEGC